MYTSVEVVAPGILVYRDCLPEELKIIPRAEKVLKDEADEDTRWVPATVGFKTEMLQYRDCSDVKLRKLTDDPTGKIPQKIALDEIWQDCYDAMQPAIQDYCSKHGVVMNYMEAMNLIKYGPGQHFKVHSDHGYSYIATVSLVGYLNDDYEGGELYFDKLDLPIKAKKGDLYIFPSSFIYSHAAMPVRSGKKYSLVTMLDWHAAPHTPEYREIEKKYRELFVN
jgi:predicted 2-oxoglutarate/Fe(II)-dependent dioxygenase YbiX